MIFALGATLAAIPLLLVGHSATANDDEPAAVTTGQAAEDPGPTAPPKGASVVVTSPMPDDAPTSTSHTPLSEVAMATTATTRPLSTTTTAPRRATTTTTPPPRSEEPGNVDDGQASWFDGAAGTCVHRTLAMGTRVKVTNVVNGRSVTCRVADRGPYVAGRVIDLERSAFAQLASTSDGVITVRIEW